MSFGLSPYGLSPYGASFSMSAVALETTRTVIVNFASAALSLSRIGAGDALNTSSWAITRLDTGATFTILDVEELSSTQFRVYTLEPFGPYTTLHQVAFSGVSSIGISISSPASLTFFGAATSVNAGGPTTGTVDIANPPFSDAAVAGTFITGADGDYVNESGIPLLRKLIIRRLCAMPGGFYYLTSDYGLGIRVKERLGTSDLRRMAADIQRQVMEEPEFASVDVRFTVDPANGVLTINIAAILRGTNRPASIPIPIQVDKRLIAL